MDPEDIVEYRNQQFALQINYKQRAQALAEQEFYFKKERIKIQLELNSSISKEDYQEMESLQEQLSQKKKQKDPKYAAFITISPKKNTLDGFQELDKLVKKCLSKYWVTNYAYCYEQRSADENNIHGLHCHILLIRGIKPSHMEREIRNTFKNIVGIPNKHIDIQYKRKEWIHDKLEYMKGNKTGDGKDQKVKIDLKMREILKIEPIYFSEEPIS